MLKVKSIPDYFVLLLIVTVVLLTRIPQLASPLFMPDGDECVVGIMARHISEGKALPMFFYGQRYGFAFLEALPAAITFKLFGVSVYTLKLTMLCLWCIGAFLWFRAIKVMRNEPAAWLALLFIISIPTWAAWAMKARGGYNTAFVFSSWAMYLMARINNTGERKLFSFIALGMVMAVIFLAQPLWMAGLLPWAAYFSWRHRKYLKGICGLAAGGTGVILAVWLLSKFTPDNNYWAPELFGNYVKMSLQWVRPRIHDNIQGGYNIMGSVSLGPCSDRAARWWMTALNLFIIIQLCRLLFRGFRIYSFLFLVSIGLTALYTLFMNPEFYSPRHLMPISQFITGGVALELGGLMALDYMRVLKIFAAGAALALMLASAWALFEFRNMNESQQAEAGHTCIGDDERLISTLLAKGIHHAYFFNGLQEWQVIFLSREQIIGRYTGPGDRIVANITATDNALKAGEPVAIIGEEYRFDNRRNIQRSGRFVKVTKDLCAYTFVTVDDVNQFGFILH